MSVRASADHRHLASGTRRRLRTICVRRWRGCTTVVLEEASCGVTPVSSELSPMNDHGHPHPPSCGPAASIQVDVGLKFRLRWQTERDDIREAVAWDLRHSRHLKKLRVGYGLGVVAAISAGLRATGGSSAEPGVSRTCKLPTGATPPQWPLSAAGSAGASPACHPRRVPSGPRRPGSEAATAPSLRR